MSIRRFVLLTIVLLSAFAAACGDDDDGAEIPSPSVTFTATPSGPFFEKAVTTLPLFAHWMHIVGDGRIEIHSIVPWGVSPHGLTPEDVDIAALGDEALILYNGLGLEEGFEDALFENKRRGSQILTYANDVPSPSDPSTTAGRAGDNPHLWLDPVFARTYLDTTWDSFAIIDGEGTQTYRSNARAYQAELEALNTEIAETLEAVPEARRVLITQHDSFVHFAARYGFEIGGTIDGDSPEAIAQVLAGGIPAVFAEYGFDDTEITSIAEEAEVEVCLLYSDVLSIEAPTYLEMMRHNANEIARCLGPAPPTSTG